VAGTFYFSLLSPAPGQSIGADSEGVLVTDINRQTNTVTVNFHYAHHGQTTLSWSTRLSSTSSPLIPWENWPAQAYQSGAIAYFAAKTDATGTASATFSVTPQPSNDYVVLATTRSSNYLELSQAIADAGPGGPTFYPTNVNGTLSSTINPRFPTWSKLFPMMAWSNELQVWRTLHVEVDATANQQRFSSLLLQDMTKAYNDADISVVDDLQQTYNKHATFPGPKLMDTVDSLGAAQGAIDVPNRPNFWVMHFVTAFLSVPDKGQTIGPLGVTGGGMSFIFMQSIRDAYADIVKSAPPGQQPTGPGNAPLVTLPEYMERIIYHESLHQFGMVHNMDAGGNIFQNPFQPGDEGIMFYASLPYSPWSGVQLTTGQLDIIKGSLYP